MTTYILTGQVYTEDQTYIPVDESDIYGGAEVGPATLRIVVPDDLFTATLVDVEDRYFPDEPDSEWRFHAFEPAVYSLTIDGFEGETFLDGQAFLPFAVNWDGDKTASGIAPLFGPQEAFSVGYFTLVGDPIPEFESPQDHWDWTSGAGEELRPIEDGDPIFPGASISFADIPGVTVTEDDVIVGTDGADSYHGGLGADDISGGGGADELIGNQGADLLRGNMGADYLRGGLGDDEVRGGLGADTLDGGFGEDLLTGGRGADTFVYRAGSGADVITDFVEDVDVLQLNGSLWSGALTAIDLVETYATEVDGDVVFDFGDGNVLTLEGLSDADLIIDDIEIVNQPELVL